MGKTLEQVRLESSTPATAPFEYCFPSQHQNKSPSMHPSPQQIALSGSIPLRDRGTFSQQISTVGSIKEVPEKQEKEI